MTPLARSPPSHPRNSSSSLSKIETSGPLTIEMSGPPTALFVSESAVIDAPLSQVWHLIKLGDFSKFWTALESSAPASGGISDEAEAYEWRFKDGSEVTVKREGVSSLNHSISYSIIQAQPALTYSSVVSTITLWPVTSGQHENSTFIEWTANFSSDASAEVVQDARYKRRDALADLSKAVSRKK